MTRASWIMLLAAGPLALWGAWLLWVAIPPGQWLTRVLGAVALTTAAGLMFLKTWARALTYLIIVALVVNWFHAVAQVISRGWPHADRVGTVLSLVPGGLFLAVCASGAWIVHKQYRRRVRET